MPVLKLVHKHRDLALGVASAQVRLLLFELGIGSVDVTGLLTLFDTMRLELRSLNPDSTVWGS